MGVVRFLIRWIPYSALAYAALKNAILWKCPPGDWCNDVILEDYGTRAPILAAAIVLWLGVALEVVGWLNRGKKATPSPSPSPPSRPAL